jgi:site-specific recombinase XerD
MQPQPLSREEVKALLAACPTTTNGIRDKALFTVLYRGGTRISATLNMRPADIDWERNLIHIHKDKGGKGRTIVIDDGAMEILRTWNERRTSLKLNGHHPFFCATNKNARGNRLDSSHYRRTIARLRKKASIEKRCHLHALRHTAASELLEEGFDLVTIGNQLGHSDTSTTNRYLHRLRPDLINEKLKERNW